MDLKDALINPDAGRRMLNRLFAGTDIVSMAGFFDSNGYYGVDTTHRYGYWGGLMTALRRAIPLNGVALQLCGNGYSLSPAVSSDVNGADASLRAYTGLTVDWPARTTGTGSASDALWAANDGSYVSGIPVDPSPQNCQMFPARYTYFTSSITTGDANYGPRIQLRTNCGLFEKALKVSHYYGINPTDTGGQFKMQARSTGGTAYEGGTVTVSSGTLAWARAQYTIPAGTYSGTATDVQLNWGRAFDSGSVKGPLTLFGIKAARQDIAYGFRFAQFYSIGGACLVQMAAAAKNLSTASWANYFTAETDDHANPGFILYVLGGVNDYGQGVSHAQIQQAYTDIVTAARAGWNSGGTRNPDNLLIILITSQDPTSAEPARQAYIRAVGDDIRAVAETLGVMGIDQTLIHNGDEFGKMGLAAASDTNNTHLLVTQGYDEMSTGIVAAMASASDVQSLNTSAIVAAINADSTQTASRTAITNIKAVTDKFGFDASNNVKSDPQTKVDLIDAPNTTALAAIKGAMEASGSTLYAINAKTTNLPSTPASQTDILSISNNTRVRSTIPGFIERPDSGTLSMPMVIELYDTEGSMEAPDSTPTITLANAAGTDLSSRVGTISNPSTGRYTFAYTASASDDIDWMLWTVTVVEGGKTRTYTYGTWVVDTTAIDFTSDDRTNLNDLVSRLTSARATFIDKLNVSGTLANMDNAASFKADVSGLATGASITALQEHGDAAWATATGFATPGDIPADYQQRGEAVTLPDPAPSGYGGGTATIDKQDVADAMNLKPTGTAADGSVIDKLGAISGEDGFGEDDRGILNTIRQQTGSITGVPLIINNKVNCGTITIHQGDSYSSDEGTAIILTEPTGSGWPTDLAGYTLTLELTKDPDNANAGSDTATITTVAVSPATGVGRNVTIQMSVTDTTALALNRRGGLAYGYGLIARNGTTKVCSLSSGGISVLP